jgi:hypothetical protein
MKEIQYLDLILNGILKNERFLKNYLIRKQKEAENKNFISEAEFFENCHETVSFLENKFEAQFIEKRRKMHDSIELLKKSNKPFKEEMDLVESFKLERLNINLSEITNGKYKDDLWYSQIKLLRENIFEIIIKKQITTFEIKDLDIYNYLDFVFSKKSISRESKKKAVLNLMDGSNQEKIISNFRIWIDYVFNQQNYWKELTEVDKKSFEELRTKSLEEMNALFENYIKGSPKPRVVLKKEFEITIIERLCKEPFQKTTSDLMEGCLPKDINKLAIVIGKLDFIKKSQQPKAEKHPEKWYALIYWFELKISGEKPPSGVEGNLNKSEIKKIGAIRCKSTGLSFYNSFKDIHYNKNVSLSNMFGDDWKEVVIKLSNYNPEIIKYIDENY